MRLLLLFLFSSVQGNEFNWSCSLLLKRAHIMSHHWQKWKTGNLSVPLKDLYWHIEKIRFFSREICKEHKCDTVSHVSPCNPSTKQVPIATLTHDIYIAELGERYLACSPSNFPPPLFPLCNQRKRTALG